MTRLAAFLVVTLLPILSVVVLFVSYRAGLDTGLQLSPQGCRMSWMSPSYIQQAEFDTSWSPLAKRYSLWLYREVGWEPNQVHGVPVLFIPGNAGSSRQVRSIASSATRQFYVSPDEIAPDFRSGALRPLDFFTVEFNEDLSAFHGPTLDAQVAYSSRAISYILSHYPANTSVIIMGHSMGGIVATSLLPSPHISAIITMSTPHILPPARFDSRIDTIYATNQHALLSDPVPIVSLCGGATDLTVPSESCVLPSVGDAGVYRRTVFTSGLEGAWTGVGHLEMVWCHQVRSRVARAALELGASSSVDSKAAVLDKWLRDGHTLPPTISEDTGADEVFYWTDFEPLRVDAHLVLEKPQSSGNFSLPVPLSPSTAKFMLFLSQGSMPPISPRNPFPLRVSVFICLSAPSSETPQKCSTLQPTAHRFIPNPSVGRPFPVPDGGIDESEGVVLFEADVPRIDNETAQRSWAGVRTEGADGRGWLVAGFGEESMSDEVSTLGALLGHVSVTLPDRRSLRTEISFPNLLSSALIVYRLSPKSSAQTISASTCPDHLLPPLVVHTSHPPETHFYPVINAPTNPILLHTHNFAPYIPLSRTISRHGLNLTIYSSGPIGCSPDITGFDISIDGWATLGRVATRYPTTLLSWTVGVVALLLFESWGIYDSGAPMPTVHQSLARFSLKTLPKLLFASLVLSYLPLPENYYLGNGGEPWFALLAPVLLFVTTGLVFISWWVLLILMWPLGKISAVILGRGRPNKHTAAHRSVVFSMLVVFILIFFFIPWQVAYLGCWAIHFFTCATSTPSVPFPGSTPTPVTSSPGGNDAELLSRSDEKIWRSQGNNHHHIMHLLLLMTWLLPLAAPVLAVWVRTLMTAGLTTPFDGDHFFPGVAPFLILVDFASWTAEPLFGRASYDKPASVRWSFILLAFTAFFFGSRKAYLVFDVAKIAVCLMVLIGIGPRYWGGAPWSGMKNMWSLGVRSED